MYSEKLNEIISYLNVDAKSSVINSSENIMPILFVLNGLI